MKFAFSTISAPTWDFDTLVLRAKEYGYDGVEIRGFLNESVLTAANIFLSDLAKVRRIFGDGGIEIGCLASSIAFANDRKRDAVLANDLKLFIDTAATVRCPMVKIFDTQVKPGHSRALAGNAFGDWLLPLGDYAAERDITIVIENALSFRAAKEMWSVLDRLSHPSIAACWDVFNAAMIGETPAQSVPVLNNRIEYVQVKDAKLGPLGATYCKLGEGDVPVRKFLTRLRGIGYSGWVTMEWEKAWLANLAEPEEILPDAITKLREWTKKLEVSDWEAAAEASGAIQKKPVAKH
jgi:sugar phosphate isomerase/epimerase